ncbi:MAG TPA: hypothetical protein PKC65_07480 [Pyrinomonadaceae bacterium]|nr:hypothetical protein [Pyrinomonadaceae bacterium]
MKPFLLIAITIGFVAAANAQDCNYWWDKADPKETTSGSVVDDTVPTNVIAGIECLLKLEGRKKVGVRSGAKPEISHRVPEASVEINALYTISELFCGSDDFADAIALLSEPAESEGEFQTLKLNSEQYVTKAFGSYRKWFEKVKKIGLEEARKQKLDPLAGSGVRWY